MTEVNSTTETDEYAYLDRGGFSSEKYKIELRGLPKFYGIAELKKLMNQKLGLNVSKIKRQKVGNHWLYACFQNDEDRNKAITALNGYQWKGKSLIADVAKPAPDPLVKRKQEATQQNAKRQKTNDDDTKSQDEKLKDAVTPYWNLPYEEQLQLKVKEIKHILMLFDNELWKFDRSKRSIIEANRKIHDGLSFELQPIVKSPLIEGYRNKCEFSVGLDEETNERTVGFRLGCYGSGSVAVAPVATLSHISAEMKAAVLLFQEFVRKSDLSPYSPVDYTGQWKCLTVRQSTHTKDIMVIVSIEPQTLTPEGIEKLKTELIEYFSTDEVKLCGIKSVYLQFSSKRRSGESAAKPIHLLGKTHIIDSILGRQFKISPEAFFQINTSAAELLYQRAIDLSQVTHSSTVLDVCCGTGTIGLCFAKHCGKVLGLELVEQAVSDARANAHLNNIENCEFFAGKAECTLPAVLARAADSDVIAVVDPPRAGLHMNAIMTLRNNEKVRRLIYISCSPASVVKNFVDLCRTSSKTLKGAPFVPVRAIPVDMFPYTKHVELIVLFEREKEIETKPNLVKQEAGDTAEEITDMIVDEKGSNIEVKHIVEEKGADVDVKDMIVEEKCSEVDVKNMIVEEKCPEVDVNHMIVEKKCPEVDVNHMIVEEKCPEVNVNHMKVEEKCPEVDVNPMIVEDKGPNVDMKDRIVAEKGPDVSPTVETT